MELRSSNIIEPVIKTDDFLITRAKNGDETALNELYTKYITDIHRLCTRLTQNPADADDFVQKTFLRAFQTIGKFNGKANFYSWLYKIATNLWIDEFRRRKIISPLSLNELVNIADKHLILTSEDPVRTMEKNMEKKEISKAIKDAMSVLDPQYKLVFILRDIEGKSYEEIAKMVGCNVGTVSSRLSRAREELRKHLTPLLEGKVK